MEHAMVTCPKCQESATICNVTANQKCEKCGKIMWAIKCPGKTCKHQIVCVSCELEKLRQKPKLANSSGCVISVVVILLLTSFIQYFFYSSESVNSVYLMEKLKKDFPSQRDETWYHFLSVLEKEIPTVKSITFLHDGDIRTPYCLTGTLVSLYTGNKSVLNEEITFSAAGFEERDYGFALEHYRSVVKKFRVFVTDLTKVSGNIARIFHTLCDEVTSDIKPSLFIFILKYDKQEEMLKPLKRAGTILKEAWSDLPDNEIFPLISRVLKNVVDVIPEKLSHC